MTPVFANSFSCHQFTVKHAEGVAKVSTDAMLLGCWAKVSGSRILDLGTGSGIIALLAAQRNPNARVFAIDHLEEAAELASFNLAHSPWSDRMVAIKSSIQAYFPENSYDALLCNPPFFQPGKALLAVDQGRLNERHAVALPMSELISAIHRLLTPVSGRASLILPVQNQHELLETTRDQGLYLSRLTEVITVAGKTPERILVELSPVEVLCEESTFVIKQNGDYTPQYKALFEGFYLHV